MVGSRSFLGDAAVQARPFTVLGQAKSLVKSKPVIAAGLVAHANPVTNRRGFIDAAKGAVGLGALNNSGAAAQAATAVSPYQRLGASAYAVPGNVDRRAFLKSWSPRYPWIRQLGPPPQKWPNLR